MFVRRIILINDKVQCRPFQSFTRQKLPVGWSTSRHNSINFRCLKLGNTANQKRKKTFYFPTLSCTPCPRGYSTTRNHGITLEYLLCMCTKSAMYQRQEIIDNLIYNYEPYYFPKSHYFCFCWSKPFSFNTWKQAVKYVWTNPNFIVSRKAWTIVVFPCFCTITSQTALESWWSFFCE